MYATDNGVHSPHLQVYKGTGKVELPQFLCPGSSVDPIQSPGVNSLETEGFSLEKSILKQFHIGVPTTVIWVLLSVRSLVLQPTVEDE